MDEDAANRALIAARLRAAREQAGLSQGQVARLMGMQRPSITEIESGRRRVSADEVRRLAQIYNVSVSWLVKEESEMPNPTIELAARELAKLKKEDLDTILNVLRTFRKAKDNRK
jgi:transcriptional regulator with XRE-family HTH domain